MDVQKPDRLAWLAQLQTEGHDDYGSLELTLGGATLLGYLLLAFVGPGSWLSTVAVCALLVVALWYGNRLECRRLHALGRRRFRGMALLASTWAIAGLALVLAGLLLALAHARAWSGSRGWADGPLLLMLVLGLYHLAQGLRLRVARWLYLGVALCLLTVVIPGVLVLRENLFLATALLVGGTLLVSAYFGQRAYRHLAAPMPQTPASETSQEG